MRVAACHRAEAVAQHRCYGCIGVVQFCGNRRVAVPERMHHSAVDYGTLANLDPDLAKAIICAIASDRREQVFL